VVKNMVVDQDNCVWVTTSTGLSRICDFASGIEEEELVQVNVFPNPASDFINVQIPDVNKCEWQLVELSGRVISQSQVMETNFGIGVKDLSAGIYLLRVNTEKGIATKKIMIK